MDIRKKIEKERLEIIKKRTKPVNATTAIQEMLNKNLTDEERQKLLLGIETSFDKTGEMLVERCFIEGVMTEKEFLELKAKGMNFGDIAPILMAFFNDIEEDSKEKVNPVVVTNPDTSIFKHRDFLQKRFKIKIINCEEAIKMMEKDLKENGIEPYC